MRSVVVNLSQKQVAEANCGDNGQTCKHYVLEATTKDAAYDFDAPQEACDKAQVNTCYQFTYYPSHGLFVSDGAAFQ